MSNGNYKNQLMHYEKLLIDELKELKRNYQNKKIFIPILVYLIPVFATILGWSNGNIGLRILKKTLEYFNISRSEAIIYGIYMSINTIFIIVPIFGIKNLIKSVKRIKIECLKKETEQDNLFYKFIIQNFGKEINADDNLKFLEYFYQNKKNKKEIDFYRSDLELYLYEYLRAFHADAQVSNYLAKVIIYRKLISKELKENNEENYVAIISINNAIRYLLNF